MSFFCSIEKSTAGTLAHTITRQTIALNTYIRCASLRPVKHYQDTEASNLKFWFINALLHAGRCRNHAATGQGFYIVHRRATYGLQRPLLDRNRHCHTGKRHQHISTKPIYPQNERRSLEFVDNRPDGRRALRSTRSFATTTSLSLPVHVTDPITATLGSSTYYGKRGNDLQENRSQPLPAVANMLPKGRRRRGTKIRLDQAERKKARAEADSETRIRKGGQYLSRLHSITPSQNRELWRTATAVKSVAPNHREAAATTSTTISDNIPRLAGAAPGIVHLSHRRTRKSRFKPAYRVAIELDRRKRTEEARLTAKDIMMSFIDHYEETSITDQLPLLESPNLSRPCKPVIGPSFMVSDDIEWPSREYVWPASGSDAQAKKEFLRAIWDMKYNGEHIYNLYKALPAPRIPYMHWKARRQLLKRLGIVEKKDEHGMLRFMSVIDDLKACDVPIQTWIWNMAISFAGRYVAKTTDLEAHHALQLWRKMENDAGVLSNEATFNILFDVATKAGKFRLGEMIYNEMESRSFAFNRFHHVSMIHYNGLIGDGSGVRAAYRALVQGDEIVDTVVLNCLISSLIKVGEPDSAATVYSKMRAMHEEKKLGEEPAPKDFYSRRAINRSLYRLANKVKHEPEEMKQLQKKTKVAPDATTYAILTRHFAETAGDLAKTTQLLDEMRAYQIPLRGGIFLSIFKGFYLHGIQRYTLWTPERLESVWGAFLNAALHKTDDLYLGRWPLLYALLAFAKISSTARAIEAFEQAKPVWIAQNEEETYHIMETIRRISEGKIVNEL